MFLIITAFLLLTVYTGLIVYYRLAWNDVPDTVLHPRVPQTYRTRVSVIIPARNEAANIAACIRSVAGQQYPAHLLQICVVNDHSTDDTADIVRALALVHTNVKLVELDEKDASLAYKKRGIEKGIANTSGELIVATDADCLHHPNWIETLVQCYENREAKFIAAPVVYHTERTILSVFQTLDFLTLQGITAASVQKRFHTMCNGANLAYSRAAFEQVNGFAGIDKLPTGDDMLLMHKIFTAYPAAVTYLKSDTAIVSTPAAESWTAFLNQRIRWASKASHYDDKRIVWVLILVYGFNVWFLVMGIASFFGWNYFIMLLLMLVVKTVAEMWFIQPVTQFFKKEEWLREFPFLQPVHILYTIIAGWLGKFGKYEWKGRVIRKS